jgi:hypothetical protein
MSTTFMQCECGTAQGDSCGYTLQRSEMVCVEWIPEWLRGSHEAAGGSGRYPHNGALRLMVAPSCAALLAEFDGEWMREVEGTEDEE